jgi:DNA-binding MarR family transcriptional regulator
VIDDFPLFRRQDPDSSRQAADLMKDSGQLDGQRAQVREALINHPGSTSAELARKTGLDRYVIARRLPDLEHDGLAFRGPIRTCLARGTNAMTWFPYPTGEKIT